MYPPDLLRLISFGYWFDGRAGEPTPYTYIVVAGFAIALIASAYVWLRRRTLFPQQRVKTRLAAKFGPWALGVSALGLITSALRIVEFPILSGRILWLASFLGLVGIGAYVTRYMLRRYPTEVKELAREELKARFIPQPRRHRKAKSRRR